jgi:hypothetical protein
MTQQIPKYGDPQILPRGTVVMPSRERNPFDHAGNLKPEGAGPYPAGFLLAPDLVPFGDPSNPHSRYVRRRGDEWSTPEIRARVLAWVGVYVRARSWAAGWQIVERWAPQRSMELGTRHLVVRISRRALPQPCARSTRPIVNTVIENAAMVPRGADTGAPELASILASIATSLDAEHVRLP